MKVACLASALVLALALAACGGADEAAPTGPVSVEEIVEAEGPVVVAGALFAVAGGPVRLCSAIAESYPPQCGGASVVVEGLDLATVAELQVEGDVSWAEGVTLAGTVADGILTVPAGG